MKKADLVNELAKFTATKKAAAMTMEIFLNLIKKTLKNKEEVFLSGFGTFSVVKRKAGIGRNRKTGDKIKIAARVLPKSKAAWVLKEAVK